MKIYEDEIIFFVLNFINSEVIVLFFFYVIGKKIINIYINEEFLVEVSVL